MVVTGNMPLAWTDPRLYRKGTSKWSRGDDVIARAVRNDWPSARNVVERSCLFRTGTSQWSRGDDDGQEFSALGEVGRI